MSFGAVRFRISDSPLVEVRERAAYEPVSEWSVACQCRGDLPARAVCVPTTVYALLSSAFSSKHGATSRYGWTIEGQDENPRSNFCAPKQTPAIGCFYDGRGDRIRTCRSEEHTSELQSLMRISCAVFGLTKNT